MEKIKETKYFFDAKASSWDERSKSNLDSLKKMILSSGLKENEEVLDVACGTGIITGILNSITKTKVIGLDLSSEMIKIASTKYEDNRAIEFINENFLEFNGDKKDAIYIFNAYPHFQDILDLKEALYRNLKSGGRFVIFSDLSLERLKVHHKYCMHVSREIKSLKDDFTLFEDKFNIIKNEDDDNHYLVIGIKK